MGQSASSSKVAIATAKQINEQHRLAVGSAETAIEHAIMCGQMLVDKKVSLAHGEFQEWIAKNCEFAYSTGARYMKVASSTDAVNLSAIRHIFPSGKPAEKSKSVEKLESVQISPAVDICNKPDAEKVDLCNEKKELCRDPQPVISTTELVAPPASSSSDPEPYQPDDDDSFKQNIENVLMADDKLAAMLDELIKVRAELHAIKASRDHYQNQSGQALGLLKERDREIEKLNRLLKIARSEP